MKAMSVGGQADNGILCHVRSNLRLKSANASMGDLLIIMSWCIRDDLSTLSKNL